MDSKKFEAGTSLAHFRILSSIGAGGMGEVYAAEDTRLGRKVALKVLPSSIANDPSRVARFEQEGRAASALNHPNILTIHDVGRSGEHYFIASELVDGVTLRQQLARGAMKLHDVLDVATQIASALAAAHGEGIVHRDIKPENIMIRRDGYVKVLDFGLAKLTDPGGDREESDGATVHRETDPGTVLGTVHYMSPEQAQGRSVDARSDIFSLGVVLYEMISGKVPFEGATKSHVIVSILEKNPASLERVAGAPHELHRIVHKALEKNRDERYQVIKDLLLDLKALRKEIEHSNADERDVASAHQPGLTIADRSTSSASISSSPMVDSAPRNISSAEYIVSGIMKHKRGFTVSAAAAILVLLGIVTIPTFTREAESGQRLPIAVADFDNQTGEAELNALSGMLITSLEQSKRLAVLTRSRMLDALKVMGREGVTSIDERVGREICARENVSALVTASVQKFGELYIVDLKVLDTAKNEYLFTAKEEGKGKESIPRMIDRLSDRVRVGLKEKQHEVGDAKNDVGASTTVNLEAYQYFFKGEELIQQLKLEEAVVELRKAVALDPNFVQAQYRLAYALGWNGEPEAKVIVANAMKHVNKAPEKERLMLRAMEAEINGRLEEAIGLWRQVVARYPQEKEALYQIGDYSYHMGNFAVAREHLEKVLAMDPKFTRAHQHLAWLFRDTRDFAAMRTVAERFARVEHSLQSQAVLIDLYNVTGRKDEALEVSRRAMEQYPEAVILKGLRARLLEFHGHSDEAFADIVKWEREAASVRERASALKSRAVLEAHQGRYRAARATLEEARKLVADTPEGSMATEYLIDEALITTWSSAPDTELALALKRADDAAANASTTGNFALLDTYGNAGEFDKARALVKREIWGSQSALDVIDGMREFRAGNFGSAATRFDQAIRRGIRGSEAFHRLAEARLAQGDSEAALAAVRTAVGPQFLGYGNDLDSWVFLHPRAYYLQGKILEARGDRKGARESYSRFLTIWKNADPELKELIDAKARIAKL